jgi:hypothetical protein
MKGSIMAKMREVRTYKTAVPAAFLPDALTPRPKQQVRFGRSISGIYGLFTNGVMAVSLPAESCTWTLAQLRAKAASYNFDLVEG